MATELEELFFLWRRRRSRARKRQQRHYVRPAHLNEIERSFEMFDRYYESPDATDLQQFCRFKFEEFDQLYVYVEGRLSNHQRTHLRPISGKQRLVIFLRYLSQGISLTALAHEFRIGKSTVTKIVHEVCDAILSSMSAIFLQQPNRQRWIESEEDFADMEFPHAIGAIDGKHFAIKKPPGTGSAFYNYKGYFSIVMLAVVDANALFLLIDVGAGGRNSDSSLYLNSPIRRFLESDDSGSPQPQDLGQVGQLPYVLLADGGFGLRDYMMTPFPDRTNNSQIRNRYNVHLSAARTIVENAFGMLVNRFRLFLRMMEVDRHKATRLIHAAVILHNFLGPLETVEQLDTHFNDQLAGIRLPNIAGNNRHAQIIRDRFVNYFSQ